MSTSFLEIYKQAEIIKNDNRIAQKPTYKIYELYYSYLKYAISYFMYDCYKDITNQIPFTDFEFFYLANGVDNQFSLITSPPPNNSNFYVGYRSDNISNYTEVSSNNYTFDSAANVLTITSSILPQDTEVLVAWYVIGNFIDNLNYAEISILSNGMIVPYLQEQENKNSLLNQIVYGGSTKIYSQAEHISAVHKVSETQYDKVKQMIYDYTYKANSQDYKGLSGGLI